jgi:hypothetical protein
MTAQSIGLLLSVCVHDVTLASSMSFVITLLMMLFGGFYVSPTRIPIGKWFKPATLNQAHSRLRAGVRWLKYLSFMYWVILILIHRWFVSHSLSSGLWCFAERLFCRRKLSMFLCSRKYAAHFTHDFWLLTRFQSICRQQVARFMGAKF